MPCSLPTAQPPSSTGSVPVLQQRCTPESSQRQLVCKHMAACLQRTTPHFLEVTCCALLQVQPVPVHIPQEGKCTHRESGLWTTSTTTADSCNQHPTNATAATLCCHACVHANTPCSTLWVRPRDTPLLLQCAACKDEPGSLNLEHMHFQLTTPLHTLTSGRHHKRWCSFPTLTPTCHGPKRRSVSHQPGAQEFTTVPPLGCRVCPVM